MWLQREVAVEKELADLEARMGRFPMTMNSHDGNCPLRIKPGKTTQVLERMQWTSYRVEEIEISGDPSRWLVHSIKVGNREQSPRMFVPPAPGVRFRKGGIMSELRLDVCQSAMDFVLIVEYVGPLTEGEVFEADIAEEGEALDHFLENRAGNVGIDGARLAAAHRYLLEEAHGVVDREIDDITDAALRDQD